MEPTPDQVRPEGQAHLECSCVPVQLAGARKASHANCAVVTKRNLMVAVAWRWQGMAERTKGQGPQWRNKCAQIILHLFVYILPRGLPFVLCWCWIDQSVNSRESPFDFGWPELPSSWPLRQSLNILQLSRAHGCPFVMLTNMPMTVCHVD